MFSLKKIGNNIFPPNFKITQVTLLKIYNLPERKLGNKKCKKKS